MVFDAMELEYTNQVKQGGIYLMGILQGKKALIFGVANKRSIAWGIAKAMYREGATKALSYANPALLKRVSPLAQEVNSGFVEECDVTNDEAIDNLEAEASAAASAASSAFTDLEYCEQHPDATYTTNTLAVESAAKISNELEIPILYLSLIHI